MLHGPITLPMNARTLFSSIIIHVFIACAIVWKCHLIPFIKKKVSVRRTFIIQYRSSFKAVIDMNAVFRV